MITAEEALAKVLEHTLTSPSISIALENAAGYTLAEDIYADRDFPPFNRVAMDGIAFLFESLEKANSTFPIEAIQFAGEAQKEMHYSLACIEVMTGAVLPLGCDTVIRYEDIRIEEDKGGKLARLTIPVSDIKKGQHIHAQGIDKRAKDILLSKGIRISPAEIAVLATVGKTQVLVQAPPRVAVISTGDELVEVNKTPLAHQIRMSNSYMLASALLPLGIQAKRFHLTDEPEILRERLQEILAQHDVILLSGGVSAGKKDYVPQILRELGVQQLFHKVAQKPGKPFWFGVEASGKAVFALPGNPVSTYLCFCKYALPFISGKISKEQVVLDKAIKFNPPLTYFVPAMSYFKEGIHYANPFEGSGSGDFANLTQCDGFIELPADKSYFEVGEVFTFIRFRS